MAVLTIVLKSHYFAGLTERTDVQVEHGATGYGGSLHCELCQWANTSKSHHDSFAHFKVAVLLACPAPACFVRPPCSLCLTSQTATVMVEQERTHRQRVQSYKEQGVGICGLCGIFLSSPHAFAQHAASDRHGARFAWLHGSRLRPSSAPAPNVMSYGQSQVHSTMASRTNSAFVARQTCEATQHLTENDCEHSQQAQTSTNSLKAAPKTAAELFAEVRASPAAPAAPSHPPTPPDSPSAGAVHVAASVAATESSVGGSKEGVFRDIFCKPCGMMFPAITTYAAHRQSRRHQVPSSVFNFCYSIQLV